MRIILGSEHNTARQLIAATKAIHDGIQVGEQWGFLIEGDAIGVKRNKNSVRTYPPELKQESSE